MLHPTSDTKRLLRQAEDIFDQIYVPGRKYSKSGVTLSALVSEEVPVQGSLFIFEKQPEKGEGLDVLMDSLNEKHGRGRVMLAQMLDPSRDESWRPKSAMRSQEYTTSWDEILCMGA